MCFGDLLKAFDELGLPYRYSQAVDIQKQIVVFEKLFKLQGNKIQQIKN